VHALHHAGRGVRRVVAAQERRQFPKREHPCGDDRCSARRVDDVIDATRLETVPEMDVPGARKHTVRPLLREAPTVACDDGHRTILRVANGEHRSGLVDIRDR
jgi:hypothetical protein